MTWSVNICRKSGSHACQSEVSAELLGFPKSGDLGYYNFSEYLRWSNWMGIIVGTMLGIYLCPNRLVADDELKASIEIDLQPLRAEASAPVVTALAASRDGKYIAAAGDDHAIRLIDAQTQIVLRTWPAHSDWIQSLVFSGDSRELFSGSDDGRVLKWDNEHQTHPIELVRMPFAVRSLSLSTQRQLLAIAGFGNVIGVWDLQAGMWKHRFVCDCGDERCIRFCPAGDRLLCGGRDGHLRVWQTETGDQLEHVALHSGRIHTAAFSMDGSIVTSVGEDRRIVRYDLIKKQKILELELEGSKLRSMCLINEYLVAAAGSDNSIRIFDLLANVELGKLVGHSGSVAVMCTCGEQLVSGAFDTTVRIWNIEAALKQQNQITKPVGLAPLNPDVRLEIR